MQDFYTRVGGWFFLSVVTFFVLPPTFELYLFLLDEFLWRFDTEADITEVCHSLNYREGFIQNTQNVLIINTLDKIINLHDPLKLWFTFEEHTNSMFFLTHRLFLFVYLELGELVLFLVTQKQPIWCSEILHLWNTLLDIYNNYQH